MNDRSKWFFIIGSGVIGVCLLVCIGTALFMSYFPDIYIDNTSLAVGATAPDFELRSLDGESIRLSHFTGQPVLLTMGATWCPDCRIEAPILQNLHEEHPEIVVLMVDSNESPGIVRSYVDEFGITFPVLLDQDGSISNLYQIFAIPTELFIDANGIIRAKLIESVSPELLDKNLLLVGVQP